MWIPRYYKIHFTLPAIASKKQAQSMDQPDIPVMSFLRNDASGAGDHNITFPNAQAVPDINLGALPIEIVGVFAHLDFNQMVAPLLKPVFQIFIERDIGDVRRAHRFDRVGIRLWPILHYRFFTVPHQVVIAPDDEVAQALILSVDFNGLVQRLRINNIFRKCSVFDKHIAYVQ